MAPSNTQLNIPHGTLLPTTLPTPTRGLASTATLSPKQECPPPTYAKVQIRYSKNVADYGQQILDYFKANGGRAGLDEQLRGLGVSTKTEEGKIIFEPDIVGFTEADLTGDSVSEVVLSIKQFQTFAFQEKSGFEIYDMAVYAVGCRNGNFELLKFSGPYQNNEGLFSKYVNDHNSRIVDIRDLNADGILELVVMESVIVACCSPADMYLAVYEWNGEVFRTIMGGEWVFTSDPILRDVDGNGTIEVLVPDYSRESGCDSGPIRKTQDIYMWDGENYRFAWKDPGDPVYRFQAALYGDYYAEIGLYGQADAMYRRAILDLSLKDYPVPDWRKEKPLHSCVRSEDYDRTEPQRIIAYSRFRLLELSVYLQDKDAAESGYAFLAGNYTDSAPGYRYASLGITFWKTFTSTASLDEACKAVRSESMVYGQEVFGPFIYGNYYTGPTVENICPF